MVHKPFFVSGLDSLQEAFSGSEKLFRNDFPFND